MSNSFQRGREALGRRLREMRQEARLTGIQLAADAGWPQPKISKLEHGRQSPSYADLETWARLCGCPDVLDELAAALRTLEEQYVEHRRRFRAGMSAPQARIGEIENATQHVRNFEPALIPGLLQTADYARYRITEGDPDDVERGVPGTEEELEQTVEARMERQTALRKPGKRFHFVMTEAALRYRVCPDDVLAGQLGHLVQMTTLATIRVGVIAFGAPVPVGPIHGFYIYDEKQVYVELYTAELKVEQPAEVATYQRLFSQLADAACYGFRARAVITAALDELTT